MQDRRVRWLGIVAGLSLACAASWLHQRWYDFEHDDAFISYRYAENWARGHGPVYNPGERVEGYTNFLLVATLRAARGLGLDIIDTARTLGTLAAFGLCIAAFWFVVHRLRRPVSLGLLAALAVALHASVAVWARSGLETVPLACGVLCALSAFVVERQRGTASWGSGFLFGLLALLRADGILYVVPAAAFLLARDRRRLLSLLGPFLLIYVPFLVWRWSYYGYPFPNSFYVRMGGGIFQQLRGLFYAYNFVEPFGGVLLFALPLVLFLFRDPARDFLRAYLAANVILIGAYVIWVGGDHMPMSRFFVPVVTLLVILWFESAVEIGFRMRALPQKSARWVSVVLLASIVATGLLPTLNKRRLPASFAISTRALTERWAMAGRWFKDHVPSDRVLATMPAGAVAYYSGLRIVDMLGVNDTHIAHLEVKSMGHGSAGHEKRDFDYVLSRHPDYIFRDVHEDLPQEPLIATYADGSTWEMRSAPLGRGPVTDDFGTVRQAELYVWYQERRAGP